MRVKTFEAQTMQEALEGVRRDMGENALILSTRTRRGGGKAGGALLEVTAAVDEAAAAPTYGLRPPPLRPALDLQPLRQDLLELKGAVATLRDQEDRGLAILRELDALKAHLNGLQRQGSTAAAAHLPPPLLRGYSDLVAQDVEPLLALRLCEQAQRALAERGPATPQGPEVGRLLRQVIAQLIPVAPPIQVDPGHRHVVALVGPTGVGKTTTLAKLAAHAQLQLKQKVVLLSLDTYRVGAVDQLQQYAELLRVPLQVTATAPDLRAALRLHRDPALVLVDTPGHSPRNREALARLGALLAELPDPEVHLVLSATTKARDLRDAVDRYGPLQPTRLLFTKVDEASTHGPLLSALARLRRPFSYLGTGQEVPRALERATPQRVADLILPPPTPETP